MSANIPFEIQEDIIKRVAPVKSLVRFRCVSKQWKSLVDSSEFITRHSVNQARPHHLLLSCYSSFTTHNYVSIVDNDTFPKSSSILSPIFNRAGLDLLDCSHGLVCLHNNTGRVVVWNPSIRKYVDIMLPDGRYVLGFGVCPKTNEPKLVKMTWRKEDIITYDYTAEVFTLSSGAWRTVSINLSLEKEAFVGNPIVIEGIIHWVTHNPTRSRIISFDLTREEFGEVEVPDTLADPRRVSISKINESLAMLNYQYIFDSVSMTPVCDVWMVLKNGSFTKLFTVEDRILGFRNNGQPVMHHISVGSQHYELRVYEPSSEHNNSLGMYGLDFDLTPYTESLLLLNHSKHRCNSYLL
ncbi:F-box protein CPR1-like [Bidens hawaiensis]|uniref:F-box protein CPR1-like n=1 Tax=Bidens hawaiensis TaxID=980011 RepID=UPI00404A3525